MSASVFTLLLLLSISCAVLAKSPFSLSVRHSSTLSARASLSNRAAPPPWTNYTQTEHVYTQQRVDHFNLIDHRTYSQRYFVIDTFWNASNGPVIYSLCGEYTCPGIVPSRLFPLQLAYEFGALIVIAEHRYFGQSYPTTADTPNLYLLNSRQALEDFAQFQIYFQRDFIDRGGQPQRNKWLVIGGSYPGALSAWYRLKYPHLVVGSLSSSGVVEAVLDFPAFDAQVERSARYSSDACADGLRMATSLVEQNLPATMKALGAPADMNPKDFLFLVADSGVEGVQYAHRELLCSYITPHYIRYTENKASRALSQPAQFDLLQAFINYTQNVFFDAMGNSPADYDRRHWMDPVNGGTDRSWGWQTCTEVGYWQTARAPDVSIRSQQINRQYYIDLCSEVFGTTTLPDINGTNAYYGGLRIASSATNIFFVQGREDPWQWAGVRYVSDADVIRLNNHAAVVNCTQCAHCVDLYTPVDTDAVALQKTRAAETEFVRQLFAE